MMDTIEQKGERMSGTERKSGGIRFWIFLLSVLCSLLAGVLAFLHFSPLKDKLMCREGKLMCLETLLFFGWMALFLCFPENAAGDVQRNAAGDIPKKRRLRWICFGLGMALFLWLHQILVPFLVSGFWFLALLLMGDLLFFRGAGDKAGRENRMPGQMEDNAGNAVWMFRLTADFIGGAGGWICLICVLSAFGIGGLQRIRLLAAGLAGAAWVIHGVRWFRRKSGAKQQGNAGNAESIRNAGSRRRRELCLLTRKEGLFLSVLFTMVFVQLARMNLLPDYDSLHYGLRSPYILDVGHGIYEHLGNINLVYTYPKGFEVLGFPLAGTETYGYLLCFSLWMALFVLVLVFGLIRMLGRGRTEALFAGMLVSLIPGVMNMAITAKSDLVTLACQLCIVCGAVGLFGRRERTGMPEKREESENTGMPEWFWISVGAFCLSMGMKPTAVVFSTVLAVVCLASVIVQKGCSGKAVLRRLKANFLLVLLPAAAWLGLWLRTLRMTGVPTTSVFTSIWEKLGFQVRWPFAFSAIPNQGLEMEAGERLCFLLARVIGVFLAPAGDDMFHVRIAWGSTIPALCLLAWIFWGKRKRPAGERCIGAAALGIGGLSLFSLFLLWQVDGNYFMLLYVLFVIVGTCTWAEAKRDFGLNMGLFGRWAGYLVFSVLVLVQAILTMGSNWAGTTGFTPAKLLHKGYFSHQQAVYQEKCQAGNEAIWSILSQDPQTRVIAWGEHPAVLQFPCNIQSYYDVTGSGGNVRLVKTLENFKQFLRYAGTQYLYVEAGYLEEGSRAWDVVRYLIEEGSLADIRFEHGNMLGRVNLEGEIPMEPEREAAEFYQNIITKEMRESSMDVQP